MLCLHPWKASLEGNITTAPRTRSGPDSESILWLDQNARPHIYRFAIELDVKGRSCDRDERCAIEVQFRAAHGNLKTLCVSGISNKQVADCWGQGLSVYLAYTEGDGILEN